MGAWRRLMRAAAVPIPAQAIRHDMRGIPRFRHFLLRDECAPGLCPGLAALGRSTDVSMPAYAADQ
jgi:hypothetical protein